MTAVTDLSFITKAFVRGLDPERQFTKGMTWSKFCAGQIHIDHIIPLSSFRLKDADELLSAWALPNLRPMWGTDNIRKGSRRELLL